MAGPETPSLTYKDLSPLWDFMSDCVKGTRRLREKRVKYLPQHDKESSKRYAERWKSAVFINYTKLTVQFLTGKPFSRPVVFPEGTDEHLMKLVGDFDNAGTSMNSVLKSAFEALITKGRHYVVIDFPERQGATTEADYDAGVRPYWINVATEDMLCYREQRIEGKMTPVHVRYRAKTLDVAGDNYTEITGYEIREYNLTPNGVTLTTHRKGAGKGWEQTVRYLTIKEIPAVEFRVDESGEPPLIDLADLNIKHFQSESDQQQGMVAARYPMLGGKGVDEENVPNVGPFTALLSADPQSEYYYVEHSGRALTVAREDIVAMEDKMALYGAEFLKKRPDRETATSRILDSSQASSPLQSIAIDFKGGVERALKFMLAWIDKADQNPQIDINLDFSLSNEASQMIDNLKEAYIQKAIDRVTYIAEMQKLGALPKFDIDADTKLIEAAKASEVASQVKLAQANKPEPSNANDQSTRTPAE